jgi:hypothetical protein
MFITVSDRVTVRLGSNSRVDSDQSQHRRQRQRQAVQLDGQNSRQHAHSATSACTHSISSVYTSAAHTHKPLGWFDPPVRPPVSRIQQPLWDRLEGVDSGYRRSDDEGVDVVGAFVSFD